MTTIQRQVNEALESARHRVILTIKKDSDTRETKEPFDPEALLYSLFEAEVPLIHIFDLFSRIVERLVAFNELNEISERQLHGLIATTLSGYPNPAASIWVSNYHNVDAPEGEAAGRESDEVLDHFAGVFRIVPARKASLIRSIIRDYLARELEATTEEVKKLVDAEDLRDATNRIVKFLRFTGLSEMRIDALVQFVEEVTSRSDKKLIHRRYQNEDELKNEISMAERSFEAARMLMNTDSGQALSELKLAFELLGRVFLSGCRLPSRPARQHSFQYLHSLLKTLDHQGRGQNIQVTPDDVVTVRFNSAISAIARDKKYQIKILREAADTLGLAERVSMPIISEEIVSAFQMILYVGRSLHGLGIGKTRIVKALAAQNGDRSVEIRSAAAEFVVEELHLKYDELESPSGVILRIHELARLKTFADCLRHGRDALILFRFLRDTNQPLELRDIQDFLYQVLADSNSFGIIFSNQSPDRLTLNELKRLSNTPGKMILWMDTNCLTQVFSRPDAFLTTIDMFARRALPELNTTAQEPRLQDYEMIPNEITGYIRDSIAILNRLEAERAWSAAKGELTPFLEEVASDYKYYFYGRVIASIPKRDEESVKLRIQPFLVGGHLGAVGRFVQECMRLQLPTALHLQIKAFSDFINRVRNHRNRLVHEHGRPSDIAHAVHDIVSAIEELANVAPYPNLYFCYEARNHRLIALSLFGAPSLSKILKDAAAGQILAVWNSGTHHELILPKLVKPKRDDAQPVPVMIDPTSRDNPGENQGGGQVSPVLLRAVHRAMVSMDESENATQSNSKHEERALPLIADWLSSITTNPRANSIPDEISAALGQYDYDLAVTAVELALSNAANLLGIDIKTDAQDHTLILTSGERGRIVCSIIDLEKLSNPASSAIELRNWERDEIEGHVDQFTFLFVDPLQNEANIRRFKGELLRAGPTSTYAVARRIFEPKHTYFLLQRTQVEPGDRVANSGVLARDTTRNGMKYDVFISYNTLDRDEVTQIVGQLRDFGVQPWFDPDELQPGSAPMRIIEEQIKQIHSSAIFFGSNSIGPIQREEMETIFNRFARLNRTVIPVILRQAPSDFTLPLFVGNRVPVDFRLSSPPPIENLIWAITGTRPRKQP